MLLGGVLAVPVAAPAAAAGPAATDRCSTDYLDGDARLGPRGLPDRGTVAAELIGWRRFGGLDERRFLSTYWDPAANGGKGGWRYPPDNGFLIVAGQPVEAPDTLPAGERVDRFGSEYGGFLAPAGTPYAMRSIPPQSLDTYDPAYTCNYHVYRVLKPFTVEGGPIAPAFAQPGYGVQYQVVADLLPGHPATANTRWLIDNGYLARAN